MKQNHPYFKVAPGVWGLKILFVNVYAIVSNGHWVLIDAGLKGSAGRIIGMANDLFAGMPPAAIILTHGHFDHRGALPALLETWRVPVFAHALELPYLTGKSAYPPPDPTVGGGLMSLMSFLYPKQPIDLSGYIEELPENGTVPFLPEWKAIPVPGHSPGQVAFFRETDHLLIAADAFVTTRQESLIATLGQVPVLSGPPRYFTYDWVAAKASVIRLRDLEPRKVAAGHGPPMYGTPLLEALDDLILKFDTSARPKRGRYVPEPATADQDGVQQVPSPYIPPVAVALGVIAAIGVFKLIQSRR